MNEVAQQLLMLEAKNQTSAEEFAHATGRVCQKLRNYLSRLLGQDGSAALFRRSFKHAQTRSALLGTVTMDPNTNVIQGLVESVQHQGSERALETCVGVIESILVLLASFIGEDLARIIAKDALDVPAKVDAINRGAN